MWRRLVAATVVLAAVALLAGCGGAFREASGNLGTRVCIVNSSSQTPVVAFQRKDTADFEGALPPGGRACAEGTFFMGNDVEGTLALASPVASMQVQGSNPWMGPPGTVVNQSDGVFCTGGISMDVGDYYTWDDTVVQYTVKRLPDDQWKEFTVTMQDTAKPSADRRSIKCPGGGGGGFA